MPLYTILATREVKFEFPIEADNEAEALEKIKLIDTSQDENEYAYEYSAFQVTDIEVEEELA
jgi:hypothetical protein